MPRSWTFTLLPERHGGRLSPHHLNAVVNRRWWQAEQGAHDRAKPWVMNGWPVQRGGLLTWTWTWLPSSPPPADPQDFVDTTFDVGRTKLRVLSSVSAPPRSFRELLRRTPPCDPHVSFEAVTPVSTTIADRDGLIRAVTAPRVDRLFGATEGLVSGRRGLDGLVGSGSLVGAVARYEPEALPDLAAAVRSALPSLRLMPETDLTTSGSVTPQKRGWAGTFEVQLDPDTADARRGLAGLIAVAQHTGVGAATAYGYGCLVASPT